MGRVGVDYGQYSRAAANFSAGRDGGCGWGHPEGIHARGSMSMDRRGFIGTLLGSVAALEINPSALLWRPEAVSLPPVVPTALLTMEQITREFLRIFTERIDGKLRDNRVVIDGEFVLNGQLNHQVSVCCDAPSTLGVEGYSVNRYIKPAAAVVADRIVSSQKGQAQRWRGFGVMPMTETGVAQGVVVTEGGISARGCLHWFPEIGAEQIRFDVLCGWDA